jgi:antitoxin component YwqK of YwqJK toxin-antitoxin module
LNGIAKEYFPEGEIKSERTYYMSKLYGSFTEYFPNGEVRAKFDVKLNAYGQGEIVEKITVGELKKGKYKSKNFDKGIIYFINSSGNVFETSENISILNQTKYKIVDEDKKHTLVEVL